MTIILGTRGSRLALAQTQLVSQAIERLPENPQLAVRIIHTTGDLQKDLRLSVPVAGSVQGLFTRELEEALLRRDIDVAIHSLKDLPTTLPPGLELVAVLPRHDPGDVLVSRCAGSLNELRKGGMVATGSVRRARQILHLRPDLQIADIRGNVPTRLAKLAANQSWDAIVLARAGLDRLGYPVDQGRIESPPLLVSNLNELFPAVGQGAIGLQARSDSPQILELLRKVNDPATWFCVRAERELLKMLGGGCQLPLGVRTRMEGGQFWMEAIFFREQIAPMSGSIAGTFNDPVQAAKLLFEEIYE